jgi:hypothetical protein
MQKLPFNLPDNAYQFWSSYQHNGQIVTFEHLTACKHVFNHPKRNEKYVLYFTFSHHTFTRKIADGEDVHSSNLYPFPLKDLRVFDLKRYELSKHLPEIVRTMPSQFCYHGGYSRYCSCKITADDGTEIYYQIVYRVWKERGKMRFHVESAYPLPKKPGKVKKVDFWVICHNLSKGKKLPQPPK